MALFNAEASFVIFSTRKQRLYVATARFDEKGHQSFTPVGNCGPGLIHPTLLLCDPLKLKIVFMCLSGGGGEVTRIFNNR